MERKTSILLGPGQLLCIFPLITLFGRVCTAFHAGLSHRWCVVTLDDRYRHTQIIRLQGVSRPGMRCKSGRQIPPRTEIQAALQIAHQSTLQALCIWHRFSVPASSQIGHLEKGSRPLRTALPFEIRSSGMTLLLRLGHIANRTRNGDTPDRNSPSISKSAKSPWIWHPSGGRAPSESSPGFREQSAVVLNIYRRVSVLKLGDQPRAYTFSCSVMVAFPSWPRVHRRFSLRKAAW